MKVALIARSSIARVLIDKDNLHGPSVGDAGTDPARVLGVPLQIRESVSLIHHLRRDALSGSTLHRRDVCPSVIGAVAVGIHHSKGGLPLPALFYLKHQVSA